MINLIAPEYYNFTEEVEKFSKDPYKVAIKWVGTDGSEKNITYVSLVEKMNRYANALVNLGLKKGDRVLIITQKVPESYYIYLACLKAGLVMIPCSEMLRAKDLTYRINHSEASAVIVYNHLTNEVDSITEPIPTLKYKLIIGEHETEGWTSLTRFAEK